MLRRTLTTVLLGVLLAVLLLPGATDAQAPTGQTPVAGPPSISLATVQTIVAGTPLAPFAEQIMFFGQQAQIDPAFALAIWMHESSLDTAGVSVQNNNPGNLICTAAHLPPASGCAGRWAVYPDLSAAIADWYRYIDQQYVKGGLGRGLLTTVETILPVYAPPPENDTAAYIAQVEARMRQWGSGTVGSAPNQEPAQQESGVFGGLLETWVMQPAYWLFLETHRSLASAIWYANRAFLADVLLIEHARLTIMTAGFPPVLDQLASVLNGSVQPVLIAAFAIAMVSLVLAAVARVHVANLKAVVILALILPVLLPVAGARFRDIEQARASMGSALFEMAFGASVGQYTTLAPNAHPTGAERIGPLNPLDPSLGSLHRGADVAAAYLFANLADVIAPETQQPADLPVAFAGVFFPKSPWDLARETPNERAAALELERAGVLRMGSGTVLVGFAFLEALTNILWTLAFGFLAIAILLAALFAWIPAVEQMLATLARRILSLFFASWGVAILQGVTLAILFAVAERGSAGYVLGAAIIASFVILLCVGLAAYAFGGAVVGTIGAITGGMAVAPHVRQAGQVTAQSTMTAGHLAVRGAVAATTGAAIPLQTARTAALNYTTARGSRLLPAEQRASRRYALAYALGNTPALGKAGALARAMGSTLPDDVERAIWTRRGAGKTDPRGHRAVRSIERDVAALRPKPPASGPASTP